MDTGFCITALDEALRGTGQTENIQHRSGARKVHQPAFTGMLEAAASRFR